MEIKHVGHLSTKFLTLSFNLKSKITILWNIVSFVKFLKFDKIFEVLLVFEKLLYLPSNSSSVPKTEWKTCPICLVFTKLTNLSPMSADVSCFLLDFRNTFWHEKMPMYSHIQDYYFYFENFMAYLDFQKVLLKI